MAESIDYGARIGEALAREKNARDAAWADVRPRIGGRAFLPLTVRHYLALDAVDSPFIRGGGMPTPEQLCEFLWVIAPEFFTDSGALLEFAKQIGSLPFDATVKECFDLVEVTFMDAPQGDGPRGEASFVSWVAGIVDAFGSEYGWKPLEVLDMPLRQVFQLLRAMRRRHDPKAIMFNTLSDRARLSWVKSLQTKAA